MLWKLFYLHLVIRKNNYGVVTCHMTKMTELWNYLFQILVTLLHCLFPSCYTPITTYFNQVTDLVNSYMCVCFSCNQKIGLEGASSSCSRPGLLLACVFLILETSRKSSYWKSQSTSVQLCCYLQEAYISASALAPTGRIENSLGASKLKPVASRVQSFRDQSLGV